MFIDPIELRFGRRVGWGLRTVKFVLILVVGLRLTRGACRRATIRATDLPAPVVSTDRAMQAVCPPLSEGLGGHGDCSRHARCPVRQGRGQILGQVIGHVYAIRRTGVLAAIFGNSSMSRGREATPTARAGICPRDWPDPYANA